MDFPTLSALLSDSKGILAKGPIALIMAEDDVELISTVAHHQILGFRAIIVFGARDTVGRHSLGTDVHWVDHDLTENTALERAVNSIIDAAPGQWLYYCYNSEYLHFPFCEDRTIGEMLAFNAEERRTNILTYIVDLYAGDLDAAPNAVALDNAHLDTTGYYALARWNGVDYDARQFDFFGGLRWRFEEYIPWTRRRIDRVGLFQAQPGLRLRPDHTFNIAEYNTYACPWHNNISATICSFRTAKALKRNPGSRKAITDFKWRGSARFEWSSRQLMDLGLMEPGQWF